MKLLPIFVACLVGAGPAAAEVRIAWSDLDLTTASGAAALDARIESAARRTCRSATRTGSRIPDVAFCKEAFRAEAVRQLPAQSRADYAAARRPGAAI